MSISTNPYKGARDFYPEDKRVQNYIFNKLRQVVESYGYQEYDAPIIEPIELYLAKTSDEIVNEQTYVFEDRGGRKVTLRPEMTPTVSRMVAARRQELAYPLRWYSIPNLWRYERPQRGRLREHWQLNVDLFGVEEVYADEEIIQIADSILRSFGATEDMFEIRVNSRQAMKELLKNRGYEGDIVSKIIGAFDRFGKPNFNDYLASNFNEDDQAKLKEFLDSTTGDDMLQTESGKNLNLLINRLKNVGVNIRADISINRGFDYYTDIVFEVYDTNPDNTRSIFGGGRYDGLVGLFGVEPLPTVGFGMGDVTLHDFLKAHNLILDVKSNVDLNVITIGDNSYWQAQSLLNNLRNAGLNVSVDFSNRKIDKQLKSATKARYKWVLFVGETELSNGQFNLKNLETGQEQTLSAEQIIETVKTET